MYLTADAGGRGAVKGPGAKKATDSAELLATEAGGKRCWGDSGSPAPGEAASYQCYCPQRWPSQQAPPLSKGKGGCGTPTQVAKGTGADLAPLQGISFCLQEQ